MALSKSDFADGLKAIKFPESAAEAASKWADAWDKYISKCTQIAVATGGVSAFKGLMMTAFDPTDSKTAFVSKLEKAMTAGLLAVTLIPQYGTTLIPAPLPLMASLSPADNDSDPRDALATAVHTWTITWTATGIPPTFSGAGPIS